MKYFCALFIALLLSAPSTSAFGLEKITRTLRADQTSYVWAISLYNRWTCRGSAPPELGRWSAGHGTLTTQKHKQVVAEGEKCAGNTFYYLVIYYTPMKGYRGKDIATFSILAPKYEGSLQKKKWRYRADLTIE